MKVVLARDAVWGARHDLTPADPLVVVIAFVDDRPAIVLLTPHVRLGGLALGVERVEPLIEPFVRRLARVDSGMTIV